MIRILAARLDALHKRLIEELGVGDTDPYDLAALAHAIRVVDAAERLADSVGLVSLLARVEECERRLAEVARQIQQR